MSKDEQDIKVLKTGTCSTLSAKSKLTYQLGTLDDADMHIRISKNTGGGFFSNEWVSMTDIQAVMEEHPAGTPVSSFILQSVFHGKSVNTPAFLLAVLAHEKLLYPMKGKKRSLEPADDFTEKVTKLMASKGTAGKTPARRKKAVTKKTVSRKAAVKKKAASRRKSA